MAAERAGHVSFPIVLLGAGGSTRMGGADKLLEPVDGLPLLRRQADMALSVAGAGVFVALPPAPHPRHDALVDCDVVRVEVPDASEGMNASLRRAFAALPADAPAAMLLLGDQPDIRARDLVRLATAVNAEGDTRIWRAATETGAPGHPIVFHAELFEEIMQLQGDEGAKSIVKSNAHRVELIQIPGDRARRDLDTPEAWAAWRAENPDR